MLVAVLMCANQAARATTQDFAIVIDPQTFVLTGGYQEPEPVLSSEAISQVAAAGVTSVSGWASALANTYSTALYQRIVGVVNYSTQYVGPSLNPQRFGDRMYESIYLSWGAFTASLGVWATPLLTQMNWHSVIRDTLSTEPTAFLINAAATRPGGPVTAAVFAGSFAYIAMIGFTRYASAEFMVQHLIQNKQWAEQRARYLSSTVGLITAQSLNVFMLPMIQKAIYAEFQESANDSAVMLAGDHADQYGAHAWCNQYWLTYFSHNRQSCGGSDNNCKRKWDRAKDYCKVTQNITQAIFHGYENTTFIKESNTTQMINYVKERTFPVPSANEYMLNLTQKSEFKIIDLNASQYVLTAEIPAGTFEGIAVPAYSMQVYVDDAIENNFVKFKVSGKDGAEGFFYYSQKNFF